MEGHSSARLSVREADQPALTGPTGEEMGSSSGMHPPLANQTGEGAHRSPEVDLASEAAADSSGLFTDDEVLPVFV
jgi:hypothetical protein